MLSYIRLAACALLKLLRNPFQTVEAAHLLDLPADPPPIIWWEASRSMLCGFWVVIVLFCFYVSRVLPKHKHDKQPLTSTGNFNRLSTLVKLACFHISCRQVTVTVREHPARLPVSFRLGCVSSCRLQLAESVSPCREQPTLDEAQQCVCPSAHKLR